MSERNVELTRRFVAAYNTRDIDAMLAYCDPNIELHSAAAAVGGGVYHGHDGMRKFWRALEGAWGDIRIEPEAFFDLGVHTLSFYVLRARGRRSGAEVAMPLATVATWRDRLVLSIKSYVQREDALRDLGVSEDELEPIDP